MEAVTRTSKRGKTASTIITAKILRYHAMISVNGTDVSAMYKATHFRCMEMAEERRRRVVSSFFPD